MLGLVLVLVLQQQWNSKEGIVEYLGASQLYQPGFTLPSLASRATNLREQIFTLIRRG